jgi:hypothetical protein
MSPAKSPTKEMQHSSGHIEVTTPTPKLIQGPNLNWQGNGYSFILNILFSSLQASEIDTRSHQLHAVQTTEFCKRYKYISHLLNEHYILKKSVNDKSHK